MKILVTGATGLVGSDLVQFLSKKNFIYGIYRNKRKLKFVKKKKNIKWIKINLEKKISLKLKPDVVLCAAVTHKFSKKNMIKDYFNSNVIAMKNIIDFSIRNNVKMIINLSSFSVYGKISTNFLDEKTKIGKQDILGKTKYLGEKLLENQPINFINLRLPGIHCLQTDQPRPWLNFIIQKIKKNEKIKVYNINSRFNNLIDTFELFKFLEKVIFIRKKIRESFVISASKPMKLLSIINYICIFFNYKSKVKFIKKNGKSFLISNKKIKIFFNFTPASTKSILQRNLNI